MEGLRFKKYAEEHLDAFLEKLMEFVRIESPSCGSKQELRQAESYLYDLFQSLGCRMSIIKREKAGDIIKAEIGSGQDRVLMIGHYDTVFPIGTIQNGMAVKVEDGMLYGPGVLDMKGGIMMMYFALKAFMDLGCMPDKSITVLLSGDEETGSTESRDVIVEEAKKAKAVLCLEPAPAGKDRGKLKTERLGRSVYKFEIYGKSAHAGNNPQEGVSPIKEIGRLIGMISELENEFEGVTANAVSVKSGTDSIAMIPGYGEMFADIRFDRKETAEEIHKRIMGLKPFDERIRLKVIGGVEKPLMAHNDRLFSLACSIGDELGVEIKRTRVGGGSDGNFTSGAGTPTLDGMGLTGEALHNENERIYIDDIPFRMALLTRMLQEV